MTPIPCSVITMSTRQVGRMVWRFDRLPSTNDLALRVAQPGLAILANHQTAGRGQHNRTWQAPPGSSVLCSVIVDPPEKCRPALLIAWAATAVAAVLERFAGTAISMKWPNDLQLGGRKLCGILTEIRAVAVVGIGVNLNQSRVDFDAAGLPYATSMMLESGRRFTVEELLPPLMAELDESFGPLCEGDVAALEPAWRARLGLMNEEVRCRLSNGIERFGTLESLSTCEVHLRDATGELLRFPPEQVQSLERL